MVAGFYQTLKFQVSGFRVRTPLDVPDTVQSGNLERETGT